VSRGHEYSVDDDDDGYRRGGGSGFFFPPFFSRGFDGPSTQSAAPNRDYEGRRSRGYPGQAPFEAPFGFFGGRGGFWFPSPTTNPPTSPAGGHDGQAQAFARNHGL